MNSPPDGTNVSKMLGASYTTSPVEKRDIGRILRGFAIGGEQNGRKMGVWRGQGFKLARIGPFCERQNNFPHPAMLDAGRHTDTGERKVRTASR
jgi:hypothetical protein